MTKVAQNRASGLLEDLKISRGHLWDALFWAEKLDQEHHDLSFFDHAISVTALKQLDDLKKAISDLETKIKHLQSKGLK